MKTYLYSYSYGGHRYSLEIPAESREEASGRIAAIKLGRVMYDGELEMKIPAAVGSWLPRLITWWKNI